MPLSSLLVFALIAMAKGEEATSMENRLDHINRILFEHPSREAFCGTRHSVLSLRDDVLVLDSRWSGCPGEDRSTAPLAALDPAAMEAELAPEYGQARIYLPCAGGKPCSGRLTRRDDGNWRHLRDENVLVIDCAPDGEVLDRLVDTLRALLAGH